MHAVRDMRRCRCTAAPDYTRRGSTGGIRRGTTPYMGPRDPRGDVYDIPRCQTLPVTTAATLNVGREARRPHTWVQKMSTGLG